LAGPGGGHRLHRPDVGGEQVLQRPRADPVTVALPVVVGSADASRGAGKHLLANGACEYLTKPLTSPSCWR
jgi:CheY-like chemotaxis protein